MHELFSLALTLFILMDPLGNVPIFISLLKNLSPKRQRVIVLREMTIALAIILVFAFVGESFLDLLKITQDAVLISGGIILFLIALKLIFPTQHDASELPREKEPFIVPLAVPLTAGPAILAAVILYSHQYESHFLVVGAIGIAWVAGTLILLCSSFLKRVLGWRGLLACEKLMGLLLTLIAVQMFLEGVALWHVQH